MLVDEQNKENHTVNQKILNPSNRYLGFSFLIASLIAIFIYWAPHFDWYYLWLETTTRDFVLILLNLSGVNALPNQISFPTLELPNYAMFGEASVLTPGITIPNTPYPAIWIIKACTGMQAGAALIALIAVTPLPSKKFPLSPSSSFIHSVIGRKQLIYKIKVILVFLGILFITNTLRIWFELYLVGAYQVPFSFAEGELSKPIGFVGTLFFAWVIEKLGIPIIDTFANWIDFFYDSIKNVFKQKSSSIPPT